MQPSHFISFKQAARRLGMDGSGIDAPIEAGDLTTQPWTSDVYLVADEVAARASAPFAQPGAGPTLLRGPEAARILRIRYLLSSGVREVRAATVRGRERNPLGGAPPFGLAAGRKVCRAAGR